MKLFLIQGVMREEHMNLIGKTGILALGVGLFAGDSVAGPCGILYTMERIGAKFACAGTG